MDWTYQKLLVYNTKYIATTTTKIKQTNLTLCQRNYQQYKKEAQIIEEMFMNHKPNEGLISRIYKEFLKFNNKNPPQFSNGKGLESLPRE